MEVKASKFAKEDAISCMPDNVVTNILDRLPVQDAVGTSVLSRNWRFKWTMLSQLVFDEKFFEHLIMTGGVNNRGRIISRLLLHLKGVITKFAILVLNAKDINDVEDINHWIFFLSRKGIKDLTLINYFGGAQVKLQTYLFSCLELKHLKLHDWRFDPPPGFHGFPNLLSLELCLFDKSSELGEFLSGCPLLEILNISYPNTIGNVKHVEIAKLENLKTLSLSLCDLHPEITNSSAILELVGSFPKLLELHLDFLHCKLTEAGAEKSFPTAFPCLKTLKLSRIDLGNGIMLSCLFEMIRRSPSLQTLEISEIRCGSDPVPEVEYNTLGLRSVVFSFFKGSENEVFFIKYLLACSPFLKKVVIHPTLCLSPAEELLFAKKLLKLHRASPVAEIELH